MKETRQMDTWKGKKMNGLMNEIKNYFDLHNR